ncbi:unnamed protein product [Closterium sp. NIES-53]
MLNPSFSSSVLSPVSLPFPTFKTSQNPSCSITASLLPSFPLSPSPSPLSWHPPNTTDSPSEEIRGAQSFSFLPDAANAGYSRIPRSEPQHIFFRSCPCLPLTLRPAISLLTPQILHVWKAEGHRALVFCQTQQMLDIVESLVLNRNLGYRRMDGSTPPGLRAALIDEFNSGEGGVFVFLLTTRVGGLGTNLTGANRVVIFDPDWNPSTDLQVSCSWLRCCAVQYGRTSLVLLMC